MTTPGPSQQTGLTRRRLLKAAVVAGATVAAGGATWLLNEDGTIGPDSREGGETDRERQRSGRSTKLLLTTAAGTVDLAGRTVSTWLFNGQLHGPEIWLRRGDLLEVQARIELPTATSIHWHGNALRNDMDGVPGMTGPAIGPSGPFRYSFVVPDAGTYWYHPHLGVQLDRGLYGPLVIEDPEDAAAPMSSRRWCSMTGSTACRPRRTTSSRRCRPAG